MSAIMDPRQRTISEVVHTHAPGFTVADIVHPCDRYVWYVLREAFTHPISNAGEVFRESATRTAVIAGLRQLGCVVHDMQPDGTSYAVTGYSGHLSIPFSGGVRGLLEAPDTWHALSLAPRQANPDELVFIMGNTGMERAYHVNTLTLTAERVRAKPTQYKALLERLEPIIYSPEPPARIHADPSEDMCRACPAHQICHGDDTPPPNCGSCCHSTPQRDGRWTCERHNVVRDAQLRHDGCQSHRYIPILLENFATVSDSSQEQNWVAYTTPYGTMTNGHAPEGLESHEIHACKFKRALSDGLVNEIRTAFGGKIIA